VDGGAGTMAAAAAAGAALGHTRHLRTLLGGQGSGPAAACAALCAPPWVGVLGRGLHSSTIQLNLGAFRGIGGTFRGCLWGLLRR